MLWYDSHGKKEGKKEASVSCLLTTSNLLFPQGVGYPLDIVVCSALGADMYDCVYPTRTARFGTALIPEV